MKAGLNEEHAKSMANCLVLADIRGVVRLPFYFFSQLENIREKEKEKELTRF